jgi:membrane-bound metal-dependent hydrolase YbcI (DUF457 family)
MDPVSHLAFGRTLIALAASGPRSRGMVGAALIGSLAPDVDAAVMPFGWDRYLRVHEIGTHSIAGSLVCACLTALVVRLARPRTRFAPLFAAAAIGTLSHIALDVVSGARVRLGWPLFDRHWTLPLVAMADPWLLSLLVAAALLSMLAGRARRRTAAAVALAGIAIFLAIKGGLALSALSAYDATRAASGAPSDRRALEASWGRMREWTIFDGTDGEVRAWRAIAGRPGVDRLLHWPRPQPERIVDLSRSLSTVRNFLRSHDLAIVTIGPMTGRHTFVLWSDIRYCWDPSLRPAPEDTPVAEIGDGRRLACGLWFGGEFDESSRAVRQIVKIGSITQIRSVPE